MKKYIALFRGINVGGKSKIGMKELKEVFESLGFSNVSTYINSGNVIFETDAKEMKDLTKGIEEALEESFGFALKIVIRDANNIAAVSEAVPAEWGNNTAQKTDILFLWNEFDAESTLDLIKKTKDVDTLKYIPGAIVWNVQRKYYNRSGMKKFIGTEVYKNMTARNVNTVRKLAELVK